MRTKVILTTGLVILITAIVIGLATQTGLFKKEGLEGLRQVFVAFHNERTGKTIWLIDSGDLQRQVEIQDTVQGQLQECLQSYAGTDERILRLRDTFSENIIISQFELPGYSRIIGVGENAREDMSKLASDPRYLEVTLYGKQAATHPKIVATFFYDHSWQAVFLPTIKMSQQWFCAISAHELWHAMSDKVLNLPGAKAPSSSDLFLEEEITAIEIESIVLNATTGGRYWNSINQIIQEKQSDSIQQFLESLSLDDFLILDAPFSSQEKASEREIGARLVQYTIDLILHWSKARKAQGWPENKVTNLRYFLLQDS